MRTKLNNKGFTLIELAIGIAIIAVLILAVSAGAGIRENANVQTAAQSVNTLRAASENYIAAGNLTYTGINIDTLKTMTFLPSGFSAAGSNPWGGNYSVVPNAIPSRVDISLTVVSAGVASRLNSLFANSASTTSYDSASSTWTATF